MSRKQVLTVLCVTDASASVASMVTWVTANRVITKRYDERLQEEVKQSLRYILSKIEDLPQQVVVSDEDPDELADEMNNEELPFEMVVAELDEETTPEEIQGERVFSSEEDKPPLADLAKNQKVQYDKIVTVPDPEEVFPAQSDQLEPPPENPDITVISRESFIENESGLEQVQLTYFKDGGVLDSNMEFVENHEALIGSGVPQFGELSNDANVVYVRNKKLEQEFEIVSDPGNASEFLAHSLGEMYKPEHLR